MNSKYRLHTRREFLTRGLTILAAGYTAPSFLARTVWAINNPYAVKTVKSAPGVADGRVLVVVQLSGGNDGLNTVVPFAFDEYYQNRPVLAVPKSDVLKLNDQVGLHPNLAKLKDLYDNGKLAVIQGVGYPNPNRSHFSSMEIWHTANPDTGKVESYGWVGRYFDNVCPGCAKPTVGVALGVSQPLATKSQKGLGIALNNPESFQWMPSPLSNSDDQLEQDIYKILNTPMKGESGPIDFLRHTAMNATLSSADVRGAVSNYSGTTTYPNSDFAAKMQLVAKMIGGKLDTKVYYVSIGGFDTHANQQATQEKLLTDVAEGIDAFMKDLAEQGNDDRVIVMTFSEFGRRVAENASGGTDHGTAAPMFIVGKGVQPGVHGVQPSLAPDKLDPIGDIVYQTDFRSVYASILEKWLNAPSEKILGQKFDLLPLIRA